MEADFFAAGAGVADVGEESFCGFFCGFVEFSGDGERVAELVEDFLDCFDIVACVPWVDVAVDGFVGTGDCDDGVAVYGGDEGSGAYGVAGFDGDGGDDSSALIGDVLGRGYLDAALVGGGGAQGAAFCRGVDGESCLGGGERLVLAAGAVFADDEAGNCYQQAGEHEAEDEAGVSHPAGWVHGVIPFCWRTSLAWFR